MMKLPRSTGTLTAHGRSAAIALAGLLAGPSSFAETQHELLFFPSVDGFDTFSESDASVKDSSTEAALDLVYSMSSDRFRLLGEFLWATRHTELERLQAGLRIGDQTFLWAGRFHSPAKFWTSEYHHGQYLQTSITRPALEEWEDDGGSYPSHIAGLLLESDLQWRDDSAIGLAASVGLAPVLSENKLSPFEFFEDSSDHGLSLSFRASYRPENLSTSQVGVLVGWNEINVEPGTNAAPADSGSIDQAALGVFADWYWDELRLLASVVYFDNDLAFPAQSVNDRYVLGYLQLEYATNDVVTVFGRIDDGIDQGDSAYLGLLRNSVTRRYMLGARWDVAEYHSLTLEIADTTFGANPSGSEDFNELRLQWSAVFP